MRFWPLNLLLLSVLSGPVSAGQEEAGGLMQDYQALVQSSPPLAEGLPIFLETRQQQHTLTVRLIGLMSYPYSDLSQVLVQPESFCEFLPLMLNVKTCIITEREPEVRIKYYVAGKYYHSPLTSFRINSVFRLLEQSPEYLGVNLESDGDSLGKSEYRVEVRAVPYGDQTLMSVNSIYAPGRLTRMATRTYITVFARNKPGFTVVQKSGKESPELITGFPAIIERSAVRAYFALKAMMVNRHLEPGQQYEARLHSWYDYNAPYRQQLHELEKAEYLDIKRRERKNQLRLQQKKDQSGAVKVGTARIQGLD